MSEHWRALDLSNLPLPAAAWSVVDFFAIVPPRLQGSLLLRMTRQGAVLAALPDNRTLLLLHLRAPYAELCHQDKRGCVPGQTVRADHCWLLALMPRGTAPARKELPEGPLALMPHGRHFDLQIGLQAQLRHARDQRMRNWDWPWHSNGPVWLSVFVKRGQAAILAWLQDCLPEGYRQHEAHAFVSPEFDAARPRNYRYTQIIAREGVIVFGNHSYRQLLREQAERDGFLLRQLCRDALGELNFDLFEGDYGSLLASGYSCASLADYLNPLSHYSGRDPHPWNTLRKALFTVPPGIDGREYVRVALNRYIGLPESTPMAEALSFSPIDKLPRYIVLRLPMGVTHLDVGEWSLSGGHSINRIRWFSQLETQSPDDPGLGYGTKWISDRVQKEV